MKFNILTNILSKSSTKGSVSVVSVVSVVSSASLEVPFSASEPLTDIFVPNNRFIKLTIKSLISLNTLIVNFSVNLYI